MKKTIKNTMQILLTSILILSSISLAHTSVVKLTPKRNAVVSNIASIDLKFNEPINLRFSRIAVYRLPIAKSVRDLLYINKAAAAYSKNLLTNIRNSAVNDRDLVSRPISLATLAKLGKTKAVSVKLIDDLSQGHYLIIWRILSADGHPVTGYSPFRIK